MIVSGDRESEVRFLAERVGITDVHAEQSPEAKLALVRAETARDATLYVGDGINDAPAMMAATVGMAIGQNSDVTASAAGVVLMSGHTFEHNAAVHKLRELVRGRDLGQLYYLDCARLNLGLYRDDVGVIAEDIETLFPLVVVRISFIIVQRGVP